MNPLVEPNAPWIVNVLMTVVVLGLVPVLTAVLGSRYIKKRVRPETCPYVRVPGVDASVEALRLEIRDDMAELRADLLTQMSAMQADIAVVLDRTESGRRR